MHVMDFNIIFTDATLCILQKHLDNQILKEERIIKYLNWTIWRNKYLKKDAKITIYNSSMRSVLTIILIPQARKGYKKEQKV